MSTDLKFLSFLLIKLKQNITRMTTQTQPKYVDFTRITQLMGKTHAKKTLGCGTLPPKLKANALFVVHARK